jgi:hypothetical protein
MFGIGSRDSTDSAQFADTISCVESSNAVNASIPIRCIRRVKLVAASDPVDTGQTHDCILNGKSEVPGNAKYFGYAEVLEPRENMLDDGLWLYFWSAH